MKIMPGLTADISLNKSSEHYRMGGVRGKGKGAFQLALLAASFTTCWRSCMRNCCQFGCFKGAWWWCAAECARACPEWCDQAPPWLCEPPIVA